MKFKTKKTSKTGKMIAEINMKLDEAHEASLTLAKELGVERFYAPYGSAAGGILGFIFEDDDKVPVYMRKTKDDGYVPNLKLKQGKELQQRINSLPVVRYNQLNSVVGYRDVFGCIGLYDQHDEFYLFDVPDESYLAPDDCEEITVSEYNRLKSK